MKSNTKLFFSAVVLLFALSLFVKAVVFGFTENDATSAINAAEEEIVLCYDGFAEADRAGANVTALQVTLNEAGELLSNARLSYKMGNFDAAYDLAVESKATLDGFDAEADSLRIAAEQGRDTDFMINVVGSSFGTVAVIVGSFILWSWLKKKTH